MHSKPFGILMGGILTCKEPQPQNKQQ